MGVPKQEIWIYKNKDKLKVPVSIGVGGSFDVISGNIKRAPLWMQKHGMEWLFRLIKEPKRIKRIMHLPYFIIPVSYTHLDVYKRQIYYSSLRKCLWSKARPFWRSRCYCYFY